ncbi:hypothetical protein CC78DRAFT_364333 [Lojkania enalia]|uniref:Uncharacterized protein n=1 Tax=Lojkania enalia TaxID=147567 RepID=A0A9P4N3S2_9PLEO|nr:hypothetical protein CC78DRAFT_364333 [Didymosphaeria enalia]
MANSRYYMSLPTPAPQHKSGASRRPPLTPSTVSSPCLTTGVPVTTRRDSGSSSPTKASTLLAKVASHPGTPKGETPTSPLPSPSARTAEMQSSPFFTPERPSVWRSESARYVRQYKHQDGYISFPDFEKFSPNLYESQSQEHTAVKT